MIVVDANILIYAHNRDSAAFTVSQQWLGAALTSPETVALPWAVIHAFLRLTTDHRVLSRPLDIGTATSVVDDWLSAANARILEAGPRYWAIFRALLKETKITGKLVSDAHIAALTLENDATLYTADRDFARFAGLRVVNPLS